MNMMTSPAALAAGAVSADVAADAAIEQAFSDWQQAALAYHRYHGEDEEGIRLCEAETEAAERVANLPACSPRGLAIKAYLLTLATHGGSKDRPFQPNFR